MTKASTRTQPNNTNHHNENLNMATKQKTQKQFDLTTRAMLVKVSVSVWNARRFDRTVSEDVNRNNNADLDAGRYNKHLLGGRKCAAKHAAVLAAAGNLRMTTYAMTLPWTDEGWRLLPMGNYMEFTEAIRKAKQAFDDAVADFLTEYPKLREDARAHLGTMYRESDYPSEAELRSKFDARVGYSPIPDATDLRVELPPEQMREIEMEIEDRVKSATTIATRDCWERLHDVVKRVAEKLAEPDAIFRDSLIGNVQELTEILTRLNVTDDERLEDMRLEVAAKIATLDTEALRDDKKQRKAAAKDAQSILDSITNIMGGAL